jgi:hypothetical protein
VPGIQGNAGTNGDDGLSSYAYLSIDMNPVPAPGGSTGSVAFSGPGTNPTAWMVVGQYVIMGDNGPVLLAEGGPFTFVVTSIESGTNATFERVARSNDGGTLILSAGVTCSPAGGITPLSAALPAAVNYAALTAAGAVDNIAVAAGDGTVTLVIDHTFIGGTAAVEPVTNYTLAFKFRILSWAWITGTALTGGGGSRVANLEINATDVGTVPSILTITQASGTVGVVIPATAIAGANSGSAGDTISIEIANGGTAITAGEGHFILIIQNMDTADAVASLADHINDLITALT